MGILLVVAQLAWGLGLPPGEGQGLAGNTTVLSAPALANLGLGFAPRWSLSFLGLQAGYHQNWLAIRDINRLMSVDSLDSTDTRRLVEALPKGPVVLLNQLDLSLLSLSVGRWGFFVRPTARVVLNLPSDLARLALEGVLINRTYDFTDLSAQALAFTRIGTGYSIPIRMRDFLGIQETREIEVGISASFLWGHGVLEVDPADRFVAVSQRGYTYRADSSHFRSAGVLTLDSTANLSPAGVGFSLDLSAATEVDPQLTLTLSLENLFGFINWYRNVVEGVAVLEPDSIRTGDFQGGTLDSLDAFFQDHLRDTSITREGTPFQTRFSPVLRIGARLKPLAYPQFALHATYTQGFKKDALTTTTPRLDAGVEYALASFFPLRLGITLGGRVGFGLGIGAGLRAGPVALDLGYTSLSGVGFGAKGEHLYAHLGLVGPVTGTFRGRVIDSVLQKPVLARVTVYTRTKEIPVRLDSTGAFSLAVMGPIRVKVEHPDYAFREYAFEVPAGKVVEETLRLRPITAPVVLHFVDRETKNPVAGVDFMLNLVGRAPIQGRTDSTGTWKGKLREGRYRVVARHPDYFEHADEIFVRGGEPLEKTFALQPLFGTLVVKVVDAEKATPLQAHVVLKKGTGEVLVDTTTDENGTVSFRLREGVYRLEVDKPKTRYIKRQARVEVKGGATVEKEMALLRKAMVFTFRNIYFDLNKATLRPESYPVLDSIAQMLLENPTVKVEIAGHTDTRGPFTYNLRLSQARAESVRRYLISKGVEPERLIAKGYGESRPIIKHARTEAEHQQNRRVEFRILGEIRR